MGNPGEQFLNRPGCLLAFALHHGGIGQHVVVVGHVEAVRALLGGDRPVCLIGGDRLFVGDDGLLPTAAADVDVRRHVDQVADPRLQVAKPVGGSVGPFGMRRRLDCVDHEMQRQRMPGDFARTASRIARLPRCRVVACRQRPLVPGPQVHERLGRQAPTSASSG